jgi:3-dehydroquinate synthase
VRVPLGERAYDIVVGPGLLAEVGPRIAALAPGGAVGIVTDRTVAARWLPAAIDSLEAAGLRPAAIVVDPGEATKSYAGFAQVCDGLIAAKIERRDIVLALGGGVVGDLAGFAAASLRRGVRVVQAPTSLLAQVDSSVGGKTGINSPHGKNLVGAFHQPALVLADTATLDTLAPREFAAGYAEVVKYGLIGDRALFERLEAARSEIFAGGPARIEAIAASCAAKAAIVARDETEQGDRMLLNLGHTFAHAFERLTGYDGARLVHGEAVAIGLVCAFRFSTMLGLCPGQDAARVEAHLAAAGLPTRIGDVRGLAGDPEALLDAMAQDKKVSGGRLTFILARGIGESFVARDVDPQAVRAFLDQERAAPARN